MEHRLRLHGATCQSGLQAHSCCCCLCTAICVLPAHSVCLHHAAVRPRTPPDSRLLIALTLQSSAVPTLLAACVPFALRSPHGTHRSLCGSQSPRPATVSSQLHACVAETREPVWQRPERLKSEPAASVYSQHIDSPCSSGSTARYGRSTQNSSS